MPRGGRRTGTQGTAYANRSDLQAGSKPLPVSNMKGQQYGQATAQQAAQAAVPMAGTPLPPIPEQAPSPDATPPTQTPADVPSLGDPTARPDEHVMSGAPVGPGPGPAPTLPTEFANARDFLSSSLGAPAAGNSEVQYLLSQMQARGL